MVKCLGQNNDGEVGNTKDSNPIRLSGKQYNPLFNRPSFSFIFGPFWQQILQQKRNK